MIYQRTLAKKVELTGKIIKWKIVGQGQEEEYIGLFSMVDSYQIDNGKLRLNCDHQVIYYRSE